MGLICSKDCKCTDCRNYEDKFNPFSSKITTNNPISINHQDLTKSLSAPKIHIKTQNLARINTLGITKRKPFYEIQSKCKTKINIYPCKNNHEYRYWIEFKHD